LTLKRPDNFMPQKMPRPKRRATSNRIMPRFIFCMERESNPFYPLAKGELRSIFEFLILNF
jgi:hypothetical protein